MDQGIKRMGELAILECKGRIVRNEAAFKLRKAILCLGDPPIIVLDDLSNRRDKRERSRHVDVSAQMGW